MDIQKLSEIVKLTNKRAIMAKLKKLGYIDCAKNKAMRHINMGNIAEANTKSTECFATKNGKYEYYGDICTNVKGYTDFEFVVVTINKVYKDKGRALSFPYKVLVVAKIRILGEQEK